MRKLMGGAVAALATVLLMPSLATTALAEGGTIRIEPRPYHGAIVTLEAGVRVFRPLPPTKYVIINPGNKTPLSLGISETKVYEKRRSTNYHHHDHSGGTGRSYGAYGDYRGVSSGGCIPAVGDHC